jgi:hypothetical protein
VLYITGSDLDRNGDIYWLLTNYDKYLPPMLQISPTSSGQMQLDLTKDTPDLGYSLESRSDLANGLWQIAAYSALETNTSWSGWILVDR